MYAGALKKNPAILDLCIQTRYLFQGDLAWSIIQLYFYTLNGEKVSMVSDN